MQPLLLNTDWLGLSVLFDNNTDWHRPPLGHHWVDLDGSNVWRKRKILFNEYAEKVCTVMYEPKSSIIDSRAGLIEIANEWLYHGVGVLKVLDMINDCKLYTINGISRLDLAVDFNPTEEQWDIIQRLAAGTAYVGGKRSGSGFWSIVNNGLLADRYQGQKIPHCQSWGHKTTSVKWKLYYKSKELLDALGGKMWAKPYILDCWRDAGIDRRDVWRIEVSLKGCNQLDCNGSPLTWLAWKNARPQAIFAGLYSQRFQVRADEGHKDRSNDAVLPFLPIKYGCEIRCTKPKNTTQRNGRITLLRHLVTSLDTHEVLLDDNSREGVLWHIEDIVHSNGLENYFHMMAGQYIEDYVEEVRCKAADLLQQGYNSLVESDHNERERDTMLYVARDKWHDYENGEIINIPMSKKKIKQPKKKIYKQLNINY